ncbi:hypothetical protein C5S31_04375 [ANME-1 cluster archaeon GoMg2]|nr:hypothetical protein [ANME-1 cluster archaeon GoMg2]
MKNRKCNFCGKAIDAERVYKWRDRIFCSANCKREYRLKGHKKKKATGLPRSSSFDQIYWKK